MIDLNNIRPICDHFTHMEYFYSRVLQVAKELPEEYSFLEIGTRLGGTALMFLDAIKESGKTKRFLITVDPYGDMPFAGKLDNYDEGFRRKAMKTLTDFCFDHNLNHTHFKVKSLNFYDIWINYDIWCDGKILPNKFAFIYFDGDHTDDVVFKELEVFIPLVHKEGIYVIDDQDDIDHYSSVVSEVPIPMSNRLFFDRKTF